MADYMGYCQIIYTWGSTFLKCHMHFFHLEMVRVSFFKWTLSHHRIMKGQESYFFLKELLTRQTAYMGFSALIYVHSFVYVRIYKKPGFGWRCFSKLMLHQQI